MDVTMNVKNVEKMDSNAKLGWGERIAYGLGDYAGNLVYSFISAFLLVYYTEVCGMNAATAASVMAISRIFDGVSDLIMGRLVDKTHSRWGKARPWLIRASIPLAISTVLMFSLPASIGDGAKAAYAFITYNLVSTVFFTMLNVPYASMQGMMTTNQYERGVLGNVRMLLATFGTMTINTVVPYLTGAFGTDNAHRGWSYTAIIMMVAFFAINLITFFVCKERAVDATENNEGVDNQPSIAVALKSLITNKYWVLQVVFLFSLYFMMSTFFGSNYYYAQYVLNNEKAYAALANALSLSQMGIMFVTPAIMKKVPKRWLAFGGMALSGIGFVMTAFAGTNVQIVLVSNIIKGIGFGCGAATMWGLLQDAITYGQWNSGVQAIGMGNSASSFTTKLGSGFGTAALGWILAAGSFNSNPTGEASIAAIKVAVIWVPIVVVVIGLVCLYLFDLDTKYDKIVEDIENGKWKDGEF
ncbi:glycoside/pentoside/hexuronide:cation symporter, GPH family [Pseudobutyrivibrio sp. ACV-2]|uniref:MFS transporter n=1 Tax=Pseudobutyrivibrio sp. ACV-2 TaxID=1520801 RepID=UPI00089CE509|nr:glycoside-pentoside-hexuronide (GPH):cation symporter [Pseudobutyrivibrio sp. ACV-2]SEA91219.1 glycoside/pentoside/hexuronide:cation symporter, GPH family [Pseudobutyrivibrio sp. ACV-2]